jgi:hypothetical protein
MVEEAGKSKHYIPDDNESDMFIQEDFLEDN